MLHIKDLCFQQFLQEFMFGVVEGIICCVTVGVIIWVIGGFSGSGDPGDSDSGDPGDSDSGDPVTRAKILSLLEINKPDCLRIIEWSMPVQLCLEDPNNEFLHDFFNQFSRDKEFYIDCYCKIVSRGGTERDALVGVYVIMYSHIYDVLLYADNLGAHAVIRDLCIKGSLELYIKYDIKKLFLILDKKMFNFWLVFN
jgi:hypothetical protein